MKSLLLLTKIYLFKTLYITAEVCVSIEHGFPSRQVTVELPDPVNDRHMLGPVLLWGSLPILAFSTTTRSVRCKGFKMKLRAAVITQSS